MADKLTPRQQRFVNEYVVDLNATQAAIRAGYSENTATEQASRLLMNLNIQTAIQSTQRSLQHRTEIKADRVVSELACLAFSDVGDILDFSDDSPRLRPAQSIPERARRAISSVKVRRYVEGKGDDAKTVEVTEFKLWDKNTALTNLAKHLGLLPDTNNINVLVKVVSQMEGMSNDELFDIVNRARRNQLAGPAGRGDSAAAGNQG